MRLFRYCCLALACFTLAGCANIVHLRQTLTTVDGTKTLTEKETARFFLQKEAAQKVNSSTRESPTNYSHTFSAAGIQAQGDVELVKSFGDIAGKVAEGAARGAKTP